MMLTRRQWLLSTLSGSALLAASRIIQASPDEPVKVALLESVFAGQDRARVVEQIKPFAEIIQKDTGTKAVFDVMSLAQMEGDFKSGKVQLAILTGLEYAWLHAENKDAQALLVASIDTGATRTVVVTKQDDVAKELKDLSGASVAVPDRVPYLTEYYLKKQTGQAYDKAFKLAKSGNVDETLEQVLDGKARAAIVTGAGLDVFKERKGPARAKKLKTIHESPDFPQATVMYNEKHADKAALEKFRNALLKSTEKPEGARVLTLFRLKGFEAVPENFEKLVTETAKAFPR